jgi:hypothetical protein
LSSWPRRIDSAFASSARNALDPACPGRHQVEEGDPGAALVARTDQQHAVGLEHDSVGGDEPPPLGVRLCEQLPRAGMGSVIGDEEPEEAAGVDEDPLHASSCPWTEAAATCWYSSVERSMKSDRTLPAASSHRA